MPADAMNSVALPALKPCRICGAMPWWRVAERVYPTREVDAVNPDRDHLVFVCRNCGVAPCASYAEVVRSSKGLLIDVFNLWNRYQTR